MSSIEKNHDLKIQENKPSNLYSYDGYKYQFQIKFNYELKKKVESYICSSLHGHHLFLDMGPDISWDTLTESLIFRDNFYNTLTTWHIFLECCNMCPKIAFSWVFESCLLFKKKVFERPSRK